MAVRKEEILPVRTSEDVVLVRTIRQRQGVAARLAELAASKDRWIREAALLALKPKDRP